MSKLDVGVGKEFPTEEIYRDENGVVHHHHYYCRRRFGFLRIILAVILISLLVRAFHYAFWWDMPTPPWLPHGAMPFAGTVLMILVVGGLLYLLRRQDYRGRP